MNPLISAAEFSKLDVSNYNVFFCVTRSESISEHIRGSLLYYIEDSVAEFTHIAKCLEIDEDKTIILYYNSDLKAACKAFWGFRATGHDEVRILIGGLKACEEFNINISSNIPEEIPKTQPYLPFNNAVIISFQDFVKKESYYQQIICASKLSFNIVDSSGNIIGEQELIKGLLDDDISFQINKATIVHGNYAVVVGMLLKYLGQRSVAVVLDSTEGFVSAKNRRMSTRKVDEPGSPNKKNEGPETLEGSGEKNKKVVEEQSRNICSCEIF